MLKPRAPAPHNRKPAPLPSTAEAITPDWLTAVLRRHGCLPHGHVAAVRALSSETSYTSTIGRLALNYSADAPPTAPPRLLSKRARLDAEQAVVGSEQRRREVDFHNKVAGAMPEPPVATCYHAAWCPETGASHLLFEDLSDTHVAAEPLVPPPAPQSGSAIDAFAALHAFWWDHPALGELSALPSPTSKAQYVAAIYEHFPRFSDGIGDRLSGDHRALYERVLPLLPLLWQRVTRGSHLTLIHGDANFSNVLLPFDPDHHRARIIDWQLWGISFAAEDLSHLIALYWDRETRQHREKDLLVRYHGGLVRHGVSGFDWEDCWTDYRLAVILRVLFMPMWFWMSGAPVARWQGSLERATSAFQDLACSELLEGYV